MDANGQLDADQLAQLRPRLLEFVLKPPAPEALPDIALQLIQDGFETSAVLRCACMGPADDVRDIRDAFSEALDDLGVEPISYENAAHELTRCLAHRILDNDAEERSAAIDQIVDLWDFDDFAYNDGSAPHEFALWFACWLDDKPQAKAEQDYDIDREAQSLVDSLTG